MTGLQDEILNCGDKLTRDQSCPSESFIYNAISCLCQIIWDSPKLSDFCGQGLDKDTRKDIKSLHRIFIQGWSGFNVTAKALGSFAYSLMKHSLMAPMEKQYIHESVETWCRFVDMMLPDSDTNQWTKPELSSVFRCFISNDDLLAGLATVIRSYQGNLQCFLTNYKNYTSPADKISDLTLTTN